jgi:NitT/TauT family transport system permease protein
LIKKTFWQKAAAVALALVAWQAAAALINQQILLVGPITVILRLYDLVRTRAFWGAVWFSFARIAAGFLLAFLSAAILAALSYRFHIVRTLLWPYIAVVKSTPIVSFIILCLMAMSARSLSVFISFLIVLPIIYTNLLDGLSATDRQMLEMARIFHAGPLKRLSYIYLPQLKPFVLSACSVSLGMSWKSGVAAEVIGIPDGSIGEMLYQAKVYLESADLFAWTLVVILISVLFERAVMAILEMCYRRLERAPELKIHTDSAESAEPSEIPAPVPDIVVENISKSFGGQTVLENFSAVFPSGSVTCIMGESGRGKTTLINILMGFIKPDSGNIEGLKHTRVSCVFQEDRMTGSMSARSAVLFACSGKAVPSVADSLRAVGLTDVSQKQPSDELSGGMRRRVTIVRAVLAPFGVLFLDEPFKGLDGQNRALAAEFIKQRTRSQTVIMVTHDISEVKLMDARLITL